jgi:ribonuclease HII
MFSDILYLKWKRYNSFDDIPKQHSRQCSYVIEGDSLVPCISAASIIAKVSRDRLMCEFDKEYPGYSFWLHKGYGTKKHMDALLNNTITNIHRKSYAPVKKLISTSSRV